MTLFSRVWDMPNASTFDIPAIRDFVTTYLAQSMVSVDCFARNKRWTTYTNDLNPHTAAEYHMDAEDFLRLLAERGVVADLVIFDPPYSPRQISECYRSIGRAVGMKDTQNARLYRCVRDAIVPICADNAIVLSFGWNTTGMGKGRGFDAVEVMICDHGAAHNATLCLAERKDGTR